jgi:hypothetical protein
MMRSYKKRTFDAFKATIEFEEECGEILLGWGIKKPFLKSGRAWS